MSAKEEEGLGGLRSGTQVCERAARELRKWWLVHAREISSFEREREFREVGVADGEFHEVEGVEREFSEVGVIERVS